MSKRIKQIQDSYYDEGVYIALLEDSEVVSQEIQDFLIRKFGEELSLLGGCGIQLEVFLSNIWRPDIEDSRNIIDSVTIDMVIDCPSLDTKKTEKIVNRILSELGDFRYVSSETCLSMYVEDRDEIEQFFNSLEELGWDTSDYVEFIDYR